MAQIFTLKVTSEEADLIGTGLGKLPLEQSMSLWLALKGQVGTQISAQAANPAPQEPAPDAAAETQTEEVADNGSNSTGEQAS